MQASVKLVVTLSILHKSAYQIPAILFTVCVVRLIINTFVENIQRGRCFIALNQLSNVNKIETGPINILNHIEFETC